MAESETPTGRGRYRDGRTRRREGYRLGCYLINAGLAAILLFALPTTSARGQDHALLILGDSLTAGLGLDSKDAFPAQLERALRERNRAARVVGAGVSGDTTAGGRARLDWALASAGPNGPDAVIVALGGNDGLRALSPAATEANLNAILSKLKEKGIVTLLAGMRAPPNLGSEYVAAFDPIFGRVSARHDALFYAFMLEGVAAVPALNQADGIHPNAAGVAEMVRRILPTVERLLDRAGG